MVQKNAASAEESAAAAEEMNAQAETMKGFVGELTALVGGSGNGGSRNADFGLRNAEPKKPGEKGGGIGKVIPAFVKKGKEQAKPAPAVAHKASAEKVIPMGESDFKEF